MTTKHIKHGLAALGLLVCFQTYSQELKCRYSTSISEVGGAEDIHGAHSSKTNSFYLKASSAIQLDSIRMDHGIIELSCEQDGAILVQYNINYDGGTVETYIGASCSQYDKLPKNSSNGEAIITTAEKKEVGTIYYRHKGIAKQLILFGYDYGAHYAHP